jgi:hypothetical protein
MSKLPNDCICLFNFQVGGGGVVWEWLCDKVCQWLAVGRWLSPGTQVSSTNKTDGYDIAETLLTVVLNTITPNPRILDIMKLEQIPFVLNVSRSLSPHNGVSFPHVFKMEGIFHLSYPKLFTTYPHLISQMWTMFNNSDLKLAWIVITGSNQ